jgi:hypothetical protein
MRTRPLGIAMVALLSILMQAHVKGVRQFEPSRPSAVDAVQVHPVTVPDMIQMTQPGDNRFQGGMVDSHDIANFSPDRSQFVILLKRGNLKRDVNEYWIEWFGARTATDGERGRTIAQFSSSSNRPAIRQIEWVNSHTISFLAENPNTVAQLYTLDIAKNRLSQITHSKVNLTSYACALPQGRCAYLAETPPHPADGIEDHASEVVVRKQPLFDLLTGRNMFAREFVNNLCVQDVGTPDAHLIRLDGKVLAGSPLYLSPDGRQLIVRTMFTGVPPEFWRRYQDTALQTQLVASHESGQPQLIYQFEIVNLVTRHSHSLLNSPIPNGDYPDLKWSPDGRSVVLSGILLPLDKANHEDDSVRRTKRFVAEVSVEDGRITPITNDAIRLKSWDAATGILGGNTGSWSGAGSLSEGQPVALEKIDGTWKKVSPDTQHVVVKPKLDVTLVEDMNSPPQIFVENLSIGARRVLLNLNPQFSHLQFGEVRDLGILTIDGTSVRAGIYLPVGYEPGIRYPLVIQTHEWSPERFWIDGPFSSASAAQALAGRGFIVAQISLNRTNPSTPEEVRNEANGYDAVISYLNEHSMLDLAKIGIVGFSRSALGVKYALTHSRYHFAVATVADGSDVGYFRYLAYLNSAPWQTVDAEGVNDGIPGRASLQAWFHDSLDLDLSSVPTPIRLEAYQPESLFFAWELFALRSRLGKPVDFIYLPDGEHVLVKPHDRMVSQQGSVDWFSFWLKGEEDPDPAKADQYKRWLDLRNLQEGNDKKAAEEKSRPDNRSN